MVTRGLNIASGGADSVVKYDVKCMSHEDRSQINCLWYVGVVFRRGAFYVAFYGTIVTPRMPQKPPTLLQEIPQMISGVLHVALGGNKRIGKYDSFFISHQAYLKMLLAGVMVLASGYFAGCWAFLCVPIVS